MDMRLMPRETSGSTLGGAIDDLAGLIKGPPKYLLQHACLQDVTGKLTLDPPVVDVGCALKHLDDGTESGHLEDLARALGPVAQG